MDRMNRLNALLIAASGPDNPATSLKSIKKHTFISDSTSGAHSKRSLKSSFTSMTKNHHNSKLKQSQARPMTGISRSKISTGNINKENIPGRVKHSASTFKSTSPQSWNKSPLESDKRTLSNNTDLHCDILGLFQAKCVDSQIYFSKEQSVKFLQKIHRSTSNRRVDLNNSWIGFQALVALCEILPNSNFFHLNLQKNQIGDAGAVELSKVIKKSNTLVYLNIASNNIREAGAEHIFGALRYNSSLVHLDISSKQGLNKNSIRSGTRSLRESLKHNNTLQILNLSTTQLNIEGLSNIGFGLRLNQAVCSLDLSNNDLGESSIQHITQILKQHEITELNISNNQIGNDGIRDLMDFIGKFHKCLKLCYLNISCNKITSKSSSIIFDMLRKNTSLRKLMICGNQLDSDNRMLVLFMDENHDLESLSLDNSQINANFAFSLGQGLRRSKSLQTLTLNGNNLDSEAANHFIRSLQGNNSIERLEMKGCQLQDASAEMLGDILQKNNSLQYLNLADNFINDKGALRILQSLSNNRALKELILRSNFVSYKVLSAINSRLVENKLLSLQEKVPRSRQRLHVMQDMTKKEQYEVDELQRSIFSRQTRAQDEIKSLRAQLALKQKRMQTFVEESQQELLRQDVQLKDIGLKTTLNQIIVENLDKKIEAARRTLQLQRDRYEAALKLHGKGGAV